MSITSKVRQSVVLTADGQMQALVGGSATNITKANIMTIFAQSSDADAEIILIISKSFQLIINALQVLLDALFVSVALVIRLLLSLGKSVVFIVVFALVRGASP